MLHMQTMRFNGIREDEGGQWLDVTPTSAWQPVHAPPGPVPTAALPADMVAVAAEDPSVPPAEDARDQARAAKVAARHTAMDTQ